MIMDREQEFEELFFEALKKKKILSWQNSIKRLLG